MPKVLLHCLRRPMLAATIIGLASAAVAAGLIWRAEEFRLREARAAAATTAGNHARSIERSIQRTLAATNELAVLVRVGKGSVPDFDAVAAEMLQFYPGVSELALAPGGVISQVAPVAGNEKALGLDLLRHPEQRAESALARDSGKLTLAGPVDLVQGGVGLVGRMPVFLSDARGEREFWGFTLVVIPLSEVLRATNVAQMAQEGYAHELWRTGPNGAARLTIAASAPAALDDPVTHAVNLPNVTWTLAVAPADGWGDPLGMALEVAAGLLVSLLLASLAKLMVEARLHSGRLEDLVARRTAEVRARESELRRYVYQLETTFMGTVEMAMVLSEMRDSYTTGHERRVATIAMAIGTELGFDEQRTKCLQVAGFLHDIGKIIVPAQVLSKPGKLSPIEFELVKGHAQASFDVLKNVAFPWPVAEVARQHHERMDGSGYPRGLKGGQILLEARILAVADVVEAMSSHRPYRAGLGIDRALDEIERGRGSSYDPVVADACLRLFRERGFQLPD